MSNTDTPAPALEPCRLCGEPAEMLPNGDRYHETFYAKCSSCGQPGRTMDTEAEAAEQWNELMALPRATAGEQVQQVQVERLEGVGMASEIRVDNAGDPGGDCFFAWGHFDEPPMRAAVQKYIDDEQLGCTVENLKYVTAYWQMKDMEVDGETELVYLEKNMPTVDYHPVTILRDF